MRAGSILSTSLLVALPLAGCGGGGTVTETSTVVVTVTTGAPASTAGGGGKGATTTTGPKPPTKAARKRIEGPGVTIGMSATRFEPRTVSVFRGEQVTWRNDSKKRHRIKGRGMTGAPLSAVIPPGGTFTWRPQRVGVMKYICTLRPMAGRVVVSPPGG